MSLDIAVVIPSLKSRAKLLDEAVSTVSAQTYEAKQVVVQYDGERGIEGAAATRNMALDWVRAEWVAFLDDDDLLHPNHLQVLAEAQQRTGADLVWSNYVVRGGRDPLPKEFQTKQWDPASPHQIPITYLVRAEALRAVGGFQVGSDVDPDGRPIGGEDWRMQLALSDAGYKFHHECVITWTWRHWGGNQSGLPR